MIAGQCTLHLKRWKSWETVAYCIQDYFSLDGADVVNPVYQKFRIFRLWFALQRWDEYGYRPFITEMNTTIEITGRQDE
ncbi:DUF3289 family protein [Nissabacter sp. SGAir0207]|uniref:DUF3289 family protein n=1 Tax=Nissabacter sp. SGAir0207 TaxID=2126321 RepID=UPI001F0E858D|nr:DUF3289 family protein [Nissabacter sp. SGAir0207]